MLRNFLAVMRDSFREAVDGFIIYVMFGLAALAVLVAVSISFDPDPADVAFPAVVAKFPRAYRDRGAAIEEVGTRVKFSQFTAREPIPLNYAVSDLQKLDAGKGYAGKYKMRLTILPGGGGRRVNGPGGGPDGVPALELSAQDAELLFRTVVYCWTQKQVPEQFMLVQAGGPTGEGGGAERVELLDDDADSEVALANRNAAGGGRWVLYAVPKPFAADVNRRTLAVLSGALRGGDDTLLNWLKGEFRRQAGLDFGPAGGKEPPGRVKLPDFLTRGLWKVVKQKRAASDLDTLTTEELRGMIEGEVARLDAEMKATVGAVTDADTQEFIRNQFFVHGDMPDATVTRASAGGKDVRFDVEVEVKPGAKGWPHKTTYLFAITGGESAPLGQALFIVQDKLVNSLGASITLLVAVILTGFFVPNMLRKGSLDLLVVKPMARWELLLYKYVGGLIFMFLVTGVTITGVWLVLAVRSGNWNPTFLLSIFFVTFIFAVLYALSTLIAVLTRSAIAAILITSVFMAFMGVTGFAKTLSDGFRALTDKEADKKMWVYTAIDVTNDVLPRYNDLMKLNSLALTDAYFPPAGGKAARQIEPPSWWVSIGISMAYISVFLTLAYWRFATRDP